MRHLERLGKPKILLNKEKEWTENFINSDKTKPDNSKYAHKEIVKQLHRISYNKCFYSEVKFVLENEGQVDHYYEVDNKSKAYEWENLFLSHKDCNQGKPSNS
jgi:hypothetical protein